MILKCAEGDGYCGGKEGITGGGGMIDVVGEIKGRMGVSRRLVVDPVMDAELAGELVKARVRIGLCKDGYGVDFLGRGVMQVYLLEDLPGYSRAVKDARESLEKEMKA